MVTLVMHGHDSPPGVIYMRGRRAAASGGLGEPSHYMYLAAAKFAKTALDCTRAFGAEHRIQRRGPRGPCSNPATNVFNSEI
ncbi:hypothetical protein EVAR_85318_1 [Eumeta japonica]|uniref:Uncharacterized protein n=1 Tax=Eumeta variegata TaxID=151549 RepID=A0A4C1V6X7_EUMVA|nr:hypothetical protein EVAR_85318_1 [Eumeta japonica]